MQNDYTVFNIPARAFAEAENFDTVKSEEETKPETKFSEPIYKELNEIAEELEECRLRNC
ncbi:hypothetical protein IKG28_00340 [Candidatus Saccharibacteria bacterium]|nr:hypothetical protein [Candidatus Saccharibacteria bacterium]MBR3332074.1 hypothetical protein [Candidatus Saccharibacteria bacterium]